MSQKDDTNKNTGKSPPAGSADPGTYSLKTETGQFNVVGSDIRIFLQPVIQAFKELSEVHKVKKLPDYAPTYTDPEDTGFDLAEALAERDQRITLLEERLDSLSEEFEQFKTTAGTAGASLQGVVDQLEKANLSLFRIDAGGQVTKMHLWGTAIFVILASLAIALIS